MRLSVLLLAVAVSAAAQSDFRKAVWGMTQSQVRVTEPAPPTAVDQTTESLVLRYDSQRLGALDCSLLYIFNKDRLVRAKYLFDSEHTELNDFIRDFKAIEPLLIEKHGKPSTERAIWEDDSTQLEPKSYLDQDRASPASILPSDPLVGLAVSLGHLSLYAQWNAARTIVVHALSGRDRQVTHQVEYRSMQLQPKTVNQ